MVRLELFRSGDLAHFHLQWRKSNQNGTVFVCNGENQSRTERYMNGMEHAKISISPMIGSNLFNNYLPRWFPRFSFDRFILPSLVSML
jgi:hypothetical protein